MKKILFICFLLISISFIHPIKTYADTVLPIVYLEFDQLEYSQNDEINMSIHVEDFSDLYGFQIDFKKDFSLLNTMTNTNPFTLDAQSIFSSNDVVWVNGVVDDIATIMVSQPLENTLGYSFSEKTELAKIQLIALSDISNIYEVFHMSSDLNDLLFSDANLVIKLSDSNGNPIVFDYVINTILPPTIHLNPGVDTIFINQTHVDEGIEVIYEDVYSIETSSNVNNLVAGDYQITYTVTYGAHSITAVRHVHVIVAMPTVVFTLNPAITTLVKGVAFVDTGCSALVDNQSMTCSVLSNTINSSQEGIYYIEYGIEVDGLIYKTKRYIYIVDLSQTVSFYKKEEELI